jgi:hypothetical protein
MFKFWRDSMKLLLLGFVLLWTLMVMGPSLDYGWVVALKLSLVLIAWNVTMEFFRDRKWKD